VNAFPAQRTWLNVQSWRNIKTMLEHLERRLSLLALLFSPLLATCVRIEEA
jgi:hypothetical protein